MLDGCAVCMRVMEEEVGGAAAGGDAMYTCEPFVRRGERERASVGRQRSLLSLFLQRQKPSRHHRLPPTAFF